MKKLKGKPNAIWSVLKDVRNHSPNSLMSDPDNLEALNKIFADNFSLSPDWSLLLQSIKEASGNAVEEQNSWNIDVCVEKTKTMLNKLKTSKAAGCDDFPPLLAKAASQELAGPLTHLIALSVRSQSVPSIWKFANVTPVPKCKNPSLYDYRPISVLSVFSKVLEQYVCDFLLSSFVDLYGHDQFGFRPRHSTLHANIRSHDFITLCLDDTNFLGVAMITFDMAKAFDKLNHFNLITSLLDACLPNEFVLWCCDFLQNRRQRVKFGSLFSSSVSITSGVPQGGKLSPFLFYCLHMSSLSPFHTCALMSKYADDIVVLLPLTTLHLVDNKIKAEVDNVKFWCDTHGLLLNENKTKCMLLSRKTLPMPLVNVAPCKTAP